MIPVKQDSLHPDHAAMGQDDPEEQLDTTE